MSNRHISLFQKVLPLLVVSFFLSSCAMTPAHRPYQSLSTAVKRYDNYAQDRLAPYFKKAHVAYPPKKMALLGFKNTRQLQLWAKDSGPWRYIKTFPMLAASGGPGPKLLTGDHQVPEGVYRFVEFNPNSHFDLSLELSYPNAFDRYHAALDGRHHLGGDIFIHGHHASIGCIAIGNNAIQQLFVLAYKVGLGNIKVIIAPDDLRYHRAIYGSVHPRWLPQLYAQIKDALRPFE